MDNRTYDAINGHMSLLQRAQGENERLRAALVERVKHNRQTQEMLHTVIAELDAERNAHNATVAQLCAELATANDNAAELGKALDMCIAERDGAFADADLARAELGTLREMLRDTMRELTALRDERPRLLAANVRLFHDNNAARAELDAMRQAHSVIMARMAAMGC